MPGDLLLAFGMWASAWYDLDDQAPTYHLVQDQVPLASAGMIAHQHDQDQDNQASAWGDHSDEDKSKT